MYKSFYGMDREPFTSLPDAGLFFRSKPHMGGWNYLVHGVKSHEPFLLVTGEYGVGKTLLCLKLVNTLESRNVFPFAYVPTANINYEGILRKTLTALGLANPNGDEHALQAALYDHFDRQEDPNGVYIIVDDVHDYDLSTLNKLRVLVNYNRAGFFPIRLIMFAHESFVHRLHHPSLHSLDQRIKRRFHLFPFDFHEVQEYIYFRLLNSGASGSPYFEEEALREVYRISKGIPRVINKICDASLLLGAASELTVIDHTVIEDAVRSLGFPEEEEPLTSPARPLPPDPPARRPAEEPPPYGYAREEAPPSHEPSREPVRHGREERRPGYPPEEDRYPAPPPRYEEPPYAEPPGTMGYPGPPPPEGSYPQGAPYFREPSYGYGERPMDQPSAGAYRPPPGGEPYGAGPGGYGYRPDESGFLRQGYPGARPGTMPPDSEPPEEKEGKGSPSFMAGKGIRIALLILILAALLLAFLLHGGMVGISKGSSLTENLHASFLLPAGDGSYGGGSFPSAVWQREASESGASDPPVHGLGDHGGGSDIVVEGDSSPDVAELHASVSPTIGDTSWDGHVAPWKDAMAISPDSSGQMAPAEVGNMTEGTEPTETMESIATSEATEVVVGEEKNEPPEQDYPAEEPVPTVPPEPAPSIDPPQALGSGDRFPSRPYSLVLSSCRHNDSARKVYDLYRRKGLAPLTLTCTGSAIGGEWWIVYYGCFSNAREAITAAGELRSEGAFPRRTPYANLLGTSRSHGNLDQLASDLQQDGYYPYSVSGEQGAALYVGAYRTADAAALIQRKLQSDGFSARVVKR